MTGIDTLFAVSASMFAPLALLAAAVFAAVWLGGKMCECGGRANNA